MTLEKKFNKKYIANFNKKKFQLILQITKKYNSLKWTMAYHKTLRIYFKKSKRQFEQLVRTINYFPNLPIIQKNHFMMNFL